ncbi:MAG: tRNA (N6-threonylcarbamoyladenosine(37)-N6)-methyltransferase TrmO [Gammaproteobacteria bacterium]|nr:tRNA (N6-threonylcarbamoyladenosine(37)-N6)-methyltransferase TrmO [Gammaproteobacteria bacterium]
MNLTPAPTASSLTLNPIGVVRNIQIEPSYINWAEVVSHIVINPEHAAALHGLMDYSHLMVIFWMDQVCYSKPTHVPQGKHATVPEVGMFACRCPYRPNPIGVTSVPILDIKGNTLTIQGLDAVDMTPVLDLKPYTPQYDVVGQAGTGPHKNIRVPDWVFELTY